MFRPMPWSEPYSFEESAKRFVPEAKYYSAFLKVFNKARQACDIKPSWESKE